MMIYKYPVEVTDKFVIDLPACYKVLTVQMQDGIPYMWVIVDECSSKTYPVTFRIVGTGNPISSDIMVWNYVGTFQMYDGKLVWHLFSNGNVQ